MTYNGRRVFTAGRWVAPAVSVATVIFALAAWATHRDRGWTWISIGMVMATVIGVAGIIESLVLRIQLTDDAMVVIQLFRRRRYPKLKIDHLSEAKGTDPILVLKDGRKVKLPSVMPSLGNSFRAWLRS